MAYVAGISFEAGYITVSYDSGPPVQQDIASVLRALDIPTGLTYSQVQAVTSLANIITVLIRQWGGYPEGVCYSILLMNALVPLIDRYTKPRRLGEQK